MTNEITETLLRFWNFSNELIPKFVYLGGMELKSSPIWFLSGCGDDYSSTSRTLLFSFTAGTSGLPGELFLNSTRIRSPDACCQLVALHICVSILNLKLELQSHSNLRELKLFFSIRSIQQVLKCN
ncbi:hypothetical protein H6P81_002412 [Aristolochia fimbriata]|uniref:Uncharacterized protein n=1 Tax=Aristolochia fimbriata TaxID=158543 RepID=A0AAV7FA92_ARIFI|nr:hypothetical protein H6P81_002412 [Aristolochia fimbriata]